MRRALRVGVRSLRGRALVWLAVWSIPEALPTALSGYAVARAVDSGFLAGRPVVGLSWLAALLLASVISASGARQVYRRLGELVEPFRDELVRRVVGDALRRGVRGRADNGAVARLTHQVEIVRDTYAGLIIVIRGFLITVVAAVLGLLSISPLIVLLVLPPFLLGLGAFVATLGLAASRQRTYIEADERLSSMAGSVLGAVRDLTARGAETHAIDMVAGPIEAQARAERGLAVVAALRTLCFVLGGWMPVVILLGATSSLIGRGLSTGAILGGLTYVLRGLQPALGSVVHGLGASGLRFMVTVERILDAGGEPEPASHRSAVPVGYGLSLREVTFRYGPTAEPVLRELDLLVPEGDHLAVVGPSGIGKSTLAGLACGLLKPDSGAVLLGGVGVGELSPRQLAAARVLIPQEAYVFHGSVWDNLTYLSPGAGVVDVDRAVCAVGLDALLEKLGGYRAELSPQALSAGERQLVALTRAYLCPAPVAVLDEATCHVDPAAEGRAERAFAERGGSLIVIAHRISSALRARRILVLDGVSATVGDHATLAATCELYQELLGEWNAGRAVASSPGQIQPAR